MTVSNLQIDFYPELDIRVEDANKVYRINFLDNTNPLWATEQEIYALNFNIRNESGTVDYDEDLLVWLSANRENGLWYRLESQVLGFGENVQIPDDIYTVSISVNNSYTKTHTVILYYDIEYQIETLLNEAGFKVEANELKLDYQNSDKYDFENYSILYSLLASIKMNALDGNITAAKESLDKAKRILKIITQ